MEPVQLVLSVLAAVVTPLKNNRTHTHTQKTKQKKSERERSDMSRQVPILSMQLGHEMNERATAQSCCGNMYFVIYYFIAYPKTTSCRTPRFRSIQQRSWAKLREEKSELSIE